MLGRLLDRTPLPDLVFTHISNAIRAGEYAPGDALQPRQVALDLRVSMAPVREALIRLRDVGLVDVSPARYTKVADFSTPEARATVGYAGLLAGLALRGALPGDSRAARRALTSATKHFLRADSPAARADAASRFLTAVTDLIDHPRQAVHLAEVALAAHCVLRSGTKDTDPAIKTELDHAVASLTTTLRESAASDVEQAVCTLFSVLGRA
ncbi:GntR family transcriptional regulator [Microbacterium sp. Leaf320]|uniref:GntR family transcriptional regulator n=1 Tax=Microbacterium sp. Leaf320 TaxID=1736334 RepID=UPI000701995C|nr:GntR family transcriptional regulator [Microbacterium sp. Leaf320]KQQ65387.1 hypothetical protein ASF63_15740 [Microbacterium sp. Leaf320]